MRKKVVVGMSGGVDSSVAAYLLKKQGYDVIGVRMEFFHPEDPTAQEQETKDAKNVADMLGIPFTSIDFSDVFYKQVMQKFATDYCNARTPNPCVKCNRYVKWEALLQWANKQGAEYVATGHYAKVVKLANGRYTVEASRIGGKDQSYALYGLTQDQLAHTLMPDGEYTKDQIREFAKKINLDISEKKDSQEISFISGKDYAKFLEEKMDMEIPPPGNFINEQGTILGKHKGITHYTIGQRKKLNLALGYPVFVSKINKETNEVVIKDTGDVFSDRLICNEINYMGMEALTEPRTVIAKIRYADQGTKCEISKIGDDQIECKFEKPVRAVTPGQAVVFYEADYVLGGGTILS
jgi:tRNA-specific 2-thiouridylase